ncbi:MAG: FtsX-like permease family protein [Thermodesulfovibrionales bacterium]|nr:FtsX-like permease family protein [Thermodesulfovibrionales bacterium]
MVTPKLAYKNFLRQKRRNLFTAAGIAVSIALLFSTLSITKGFEKRMGTELQRTGIDFLIVPVSCAHEVASLLFYGKFTPTFLDQAIVEEIKRSPGIEIASPIIVAQMPDPKKNRKTLIYGYESEYIKKIKPDWRIKGEMPAGWDALRLNKILVGSDIAKEKGLKIGDSISYGSWTFLVSGILERTFSKDDAFIYAEIRTVQEVAIKTTGLRVIEVDDPTCVLKHRITDDPISAVAVKLKGAASFMEVKSDLTKRIPNIKTVTVSDAVKSVSAIAASAKTLSLSIVIVALMVGAAGIINSMLITVNEQTQEIGMMRAIGALKSDIFKMTIYESLIITGTGAIAGIILAIVGASLIEEIIGRLIPSVYSKGLLAFDIELAAVCFLMSLILGICAGLYPACKASKVSPVEAIKRL